MSYTTHPAGTSPHQRSPMAEHFWVVGACTLQYTENNPRHKARKETPCGDFANLVSSLSR